MENLKFLKRQVSVFCFLRNLVTTPDFPRSDLIWEHEWDTPANENQAFVRHFPLKSVWNCIGDDPSKENGNKYENGTFFLSLWRNSFCIRGPGLPGVCWSSLG